MTKTEKNPISNSIEENPINYITECPFCFEPFTNATPRLFAWNCYHPCCVNCLSQLVKHKNFEKCAICKSSIQKRMKYTSDFITNKISCERTLWIGGDLNHLHKDFDIEDLKDTNQELIIKEFVANIPVVIKKKWMFTEKINSLKEKWKNFDCEQSLFGKQI